MRDDAGMRVTVIGSGDAFGAGGRLQTCFHVQASGAAYLIDCGATSVIGLRTAGLDPNAIDAIFITHLHGDHFGGLIWMLLDAQYVSKRTRPLIVTGPAGLEDRFWQATETLYAGSAKATRHYALTFLAYDAGGALAAAGARIAAFEVEHPSGATPYALRIEADGRTIAFSGDTEWVETLVPAANGADLFICECYQYDVNVRYHLNYQTIAANFDRLGARRVMLTHMGAAMLARAGEVDGSRFLLAHDGLTLEL